MYDFPPYRPPSEAYSALIRVTHGCPWNRCTFCGMYKDTPFRYRSLEEITSDVKEARDIFGGFQAVFIGDSDSLLHRGIVEVIRLISDTYPDMQSITTYARAHTLARKDLHELRSLKEAGLTRVHVGLESGDGVILKRIEKGATPEIIVRGGLNAKRAGLELCFYVLCGIGGESRWQPHADGTSDVINSVGPDFIRLRTLSLVQGAPLYDLWQSGGFDPIKPISRLRETRRLIEKINISGCKLASDHLTNNLWAPVGIVYRGVNGRFPEDKVRMLETIDEAIKKIDGRDDILDAHTLVQRGIIERL